MSALTDALRDIYAKRLAAQGMGYVGGARTTSGPRYRSGYGRAAGLYEASVGMGRRRRRRRSAAPRRRRRRVVRGRSLYVASIGQGRRRRRRRSHAPRRRRRSRRGGSVLSDLHGYVKRKRFASRGLKYIQSHVGKSSRTGKFLGALRSGVRKLGYGRRRRRCSRRRRRRRGGSVLSDIHGYVKRKRFASRGLKYLRDHVGKSSRAGQVLGALRSGVRKLGYGRRRKAAKGRRRLSGWQLFVKSFARSHKSLPASQLFKAASRAYHARR